MPGVIPDYMKAAYAYLGTKEAPGSANNPVVVKMFGLAEGPPVSADSVPWCAAFVAACLKIGKVPNEARKSLRLWAAEYANVGVKLKNPVFGAIGVKTRNGGGHVGFVVAANKDYVWLLGGNQGDMVKIARFNRKDFTSFTLPTGIDPKTLPPLPKEGRGAVNPSQV